MVFLRIFEPDGYPDSWYLFSATAARFDEYFGFTDAEVKTMLKHYGLENRYDRLCFCL